MKKRTATRRANNGDNLLPVTASDAAIAEKKLKPGTRSRSGGNGLCSTLFGIFLMAFVVVSLLIYYFGAEDVVAPTGLHPIKKYIHKLTKKKEKKKKIDADLRDMIHKVGKEHLAKNMDRVKVTGSVEKLPLSEFHWLHYAFQNSDIVLLYFAASWCPVCKPVTDQLDSLFRNLLLPPPQEDAKDPPERKNASLVWVSSCKSQEEMEDYRRENWIVIPFGSEERDNLKRHFKTCARSEMTSLGIEREREIPTLIVVSTDTRQVLTYDGVNHLAEKGERALDHWMSLLLQEQKKLLLSKFQGSRYGDPYLTD